MLNPDVRRVLDGTSLGHLATVLPDGSPHTTPVFVGTAPDRHHEPRHRDRPGPLPRPRQQPDGRLTTRTTQRPGAGDTTPAPGRFRLG